MGAPNDLLNVGGGISWLKRGEVVEAAVDSFSLLRRAHRELAKMEMHAPRTQRWDACVGDAHVGDACAKDARATLLACVQKMPASTPMRASKRYPRRPHTRVVKIH